jgi:hypothetical protein
VLAAERDVMADELANTREIGAVPRLSGPPMRQTVGPAPRRRAPAAAGRAGKARRRDYAWPALSAAIARQHDSLPPNGPRPRPTMPRLRFMLRGDGGGA